MVLKPPLFLYQTVVAHLKMNKISTIISLFVALNSLGQNNSDSENYGADKYEWNKLLTVTVQSDDFAEYDSDEKMIADLESITNRQNCNDIRKWKSAFATLPYGPNKDIAIEKTYILICEFESGLKIPFRYFPKQYAIFDMRKEFRYYYSFPELNNRMRNVADKCINQIDE